MKRILIVDDDESNRWILKIILEKNLKEIKIEEAKNGKEGLEKIKKEKYDLVLTDY